MCIAAEKCIALFLNLFPVKEHHGAGLILFFEERECAASTKNSQKST
jgi:hypothetical protein